jgi:hypothetical protein
MVEIFPIPRKRERAMTDARKGLQPIGGAFAI